jgi:ssDNA-binding Zn-finger/Zn-ribbon topoisomerase 1
MFIPSFEPEQGETGGETPADVPGPRDAGADLITEIKEHRQEDMRTPAGQEDGECRISVSHDQHDSSGLEGHIPSIDESIPVKGYDQDFDSEPEDEDIEKKIAAFVEELSMKCPLCRVSGIVPRTTARGKSYYKCSNDECNFISWGKPFYLPCPRCENPFLIETPDSRGNLILKCPKTTCLHWQKFPWDEDKEKDIGSPEQEPSAVTTKKPRRIVRRRKRVVVRRKS